MAKLALNKTTLNREGGRLKAFRQFVPALDLKRKQLLAARQETLQLLQANQLKLQDLYLCVSEKLPMLAGAEIELSQLLQVQKVEVKYSNLVGLELPELAEFKVELSEYSRLVLPHWVDTVLLLQEQALKLEVEIRIYQQRLQILETGLQKTTQRLNLFDKVLIPQTEKNIRKIRIALSDAERAGVVRAKIAKNKRRRLQL
ncbi:V-type ATP synthase subunit D [Neptuniibacter sp. QD48_11]|uniref:V-type ATP synthase subunit D n=1 Tax=unclassified Neptuniibacter TaxID=2630693 RepID=UPI0039F46F9A